MTDIFSHQADHQRLRPFLQAMTHALSAKLGQPILMTRDERTHVIDTQRRRLVDGLGSLGNVKMGYSCESVKSGRSAGSSRNCAIPTHSRTAATPV